MQKIIYLVGLVTICWNTAYSQQEILYKQVDTTSLYLKVYQSVQTEGSEKKPAMVFFFGGGWTSGSIDQFEPHAKYFSKRGITCFLADYRVSSRQQTTPFESLKDAKSAIRYIRAHAEEWGIDTARLVAAGGSAGGQLAAAAAMVDAYQEDTDDREISCRPNALVLFNPVIDNGPGGYGYERIGEAFPDFSPLHNIRSGAPPAVMFLGTNDRLIPVETARYYQKVMERVGSRCELFLYEGADHGFFNYRNFDYYTQTVLESDRFLQSIGYLGAEPIVAIE
ncbi:MAG: alpha/beta hydrolase [Lunatimonas sp.]|uniref:alpha/beta hydrolase n=1 Tax=Lunatimonas sp. TaxID=2060141 RepID=UPI00263B73AD|nr:alpha/beta hydrolase [Lunatimonas sp.]MCC5939230.1 alpha/beta hydrolase [Lunatimonas sp.]